MVDNISEPPSPDGVLKLRQFIGKPIITELLTRSCIFQSASIKRLILKPSWEGTEECTWYDTVSLFWKNNLQNL